MQTLSLASEQFAGIIVDPALVKLKTSVDPNDAKTLNISLSYPSDKLILISLSAEENITSLLFAEMLNLPLLTERLNVITRQVVQNHYFVGLTVLKVSGGFQWRVGATLNGAFVDGLTQILDFETRPDGKFDVTLRDDNDGLIYFSKKPFKVEVIGF